MNVIEDWEALPLSDVQRKSILHVQQVVVAPLQATSVSMQQLLSPTIPQAVGNEEPVEPSAACADYADDPWVVFKQHKAIETNQRFLEWYSVLESVMEEEHAAMYRQHLDKLKLHQELCQTMLDTVQRLKQRKDALMTDYNNVESKSQGLQDTCERLLQEQVHYEKLADAVADHLSYYTELERVAKILNAPGDDLCLHADFIPLLARIDSCLEFIESHPEYRDSEVYMLRFKQCLMRGLYLITSHFSQIMQGLLMETQQALRNVSATDGPNESVMAALFTVKFKTMAAGLQPLTAEIEARCTKHPECLTLLNDCYQAYFRTRLPLLQPILQDFISKLSQSAQDLVSFTRRGCSYISQLCMDEFSLFFCFFESGEEEVKAYLDQLASSLYEYLRPQILKETQIETLSEMCTILTAMMTQTQDDTERPLEESVGKILQDVQARLVFRAQDYVRLEIQGYQPPHDFLGTYPDRLKEKAANSAEEQTDFGDDSWYPTMKSALYILSKLYRMVHPSVFEDFSQEVIESTLESLNKASQQMGQLQKIDILLFLAKHLLNLREQVVPFESNFVQNQRSLDFSSLFGAVQDMLSSSMGGIADSLLGLVQNSVPKVVEKKVDAKRKLDRELKRVCEETIMFVSKSSVEPLTSFMLKVSAFRIRQQNQAAMSLKDQPFGNTNELWDAYDSFLQCIDTRLKPQSQKVKLYISEDRHARVLLVAVKNAVMDQYQKFYDIVQSEYDESVRSKYKSTASLNVLVDEAIGSNIVVLQVGNKIDP